MKNFLSLLFFVTLASLTISCGSKKQETEETSVVTDTTMQQTPAIAPDTTSGNAPTATPVATTPPVAATNAGKFKASETFTGTVGSTKVVFKQQSYTSYRLKQGDKVTSGALNTERGYEKDKDATVYILNPDKPAREQKYFVRMTNGKVMMLDANRKPVANAKFVKKTK